MSRVLFAFVVFVFGLTLALAAPASAGPYMSWGQWTSGKGVPFRQCWDRAAQALRSVGLTAEQDGRFFHGSNDVFTASLICYDLGNNRYTVTITVAAQVGAYSPMTTDQVRDRIAAVIFGTQAAGCASTSPVGRWRWWDGSGIATFSSNGAALLVRNDGTKISGSLQALADGSYQVHWEVGTDDYFRVSPDGMSLPGNYIGNTATSTRVC